MKYIYLILACVLIQSCQPKMNSEQNELVASKIAPISDAVLESAIIYEANIRQYSPEGTFEKFTEDIPQLKELGVKIIWLMPIFPISKTNSKGSLGSYYAVSDYTGVNPEFGTLEDVLRLIEVAHENDMYVILDWVANHTGWDHHWITENPEYYTKDEHGNITHPVNTDWTDTADLNYDNHELRTQMMEDMLYWIKEADIDGFRCDMAAMVPMDFWKKTIKRLREEKSIFMLAEAWEPEVFDNGFEMAYGWDTHHKMNHMAKGNKVREWDARMHEIDSLYKKSDILMNFLTNHDENSWQGTVKERMGAASEVFLALSYCTPGMPLIYSGQEYDMDKRLRFFEKDTIDRTKGEVWPMMQKLAQLKIDNRALDVGKKAGAYMRVPTSLDSSVLMFTRSKEGNSITFMANLSNNEVTFTADKVGISKDYLSSEKIEFAVDMPVNLKPWEYRILID